MSSVLFEVEWVGHSSLQWPHLLFTPSIAGVGIIIVIASLTIDSLLAGHLLSLFLFLSLYREATQGIS